MVVGPTGPETKNDSAGEGQQKNYQTKSDERYGPKSHAGEGQQKITALLGVVTESLTPFLVEEEAYFKTRKWCLKEQKYGPGSQRVSKTKMTLLPKASSKLLPCPDRRSRGQETLSTEVAENIPIVGGCCQAIRTS
jgi:hypothetical protein